MKRRLLAGLAALAGIAVLGGFVCLSPVAQAPRLVLPEAALSPRVADPGVALTFVRFDGDDAAPAVALVRSMDAAAVTVVALPVYGGPISADPFAAIQRFGLQRLIALVQDPAAPTRTIARSALLPAGLGERHVATGTNFREHAEEVGFVAPFFFPKFGAATPTVAAVEAGRGMLLDYEVEICMRFDRAIRTMADFDAALKGFFLCGDFTDRATLMRLLPDEPTTSGIGFSDAKSGPGYFPTGPFLVVPTDWRGFVEAERIATVVNGDRRQDARGGDMTLDFRSLMERVLSEGRSETWLYRGGAVALIPDGALPNGQTLMSGTPAGVAFRPPDIREIACGGVMFLCLGGFLSHATLRSFVVERYAERLATARRFLAVGDMVRFESERLGVIDVTIR
jgi:2-keto-4-pentenoate hydratase/2-oxohepta-3-ene-1,7-dioic acid hydratase in catechol pathway